MALTVSTAQCGPSLSTGIAPVRHACQRPSSPKTLADSKALVAMEPASEDGATGDPDCDALRAGEVEAEGAE